MTSDPKVSKGERLYVRPNKLVNEMTSDERSDFANAVADMFAAQMKKSQESSSYGSDIDTDLDEVSERKNEMNVSEEYAIWSGGETWIGKVDGGGSNLPPVKWEILHLVVGEGGLEPPHPFEYRHLKPARLPFRHSP